MRTKFLIVISSIFITACSSSPKLVNYNSVEKLDRQELINGINDCKDNDLKSLCFLYSRAITEFVKDTCTC